MMNALNDPGMQLLIFYNHPINKPYRLNLALQTVRSGDSDTLLFAC